MYFLPILSSLMLGEGKVGKVKGAAEPFLIGRNPGLFPC